MTVNLADFAQHLIHITLLGFVGFLLAMLLTPVYTYFAYRYRFWKVQRADSVTGEPAKIFNKLHAAKFHRNIPTMAGLIFVVVITIVTIAANLDRQQTWLPLAALLGGAVVGLLDDIINLKGLGGGVKGLRAPIKFLMITTVGIVGGLFFYYKLGYTDLHVPFLGVWHLGLWIIPLFVIAIVATGNAVNISDGLDGLAGGLSATAFGAFGIIAMLQGNFGIAAFCFTVVGALLSYIWFNIFPARFFMGDVGSFALGTSLGVVAMLTNSVLLLPVIGVLFAVEAGSSLLQILGKRLLGRKLFIMAPIHHHFEAAGWPETKVTMRFWVIAQGAAFIGLLLALSGGIIVQ